MRKMLVVAVREYLAAVRTKTFLITLIVMPVLMGGTAFFQWLLRDYHDTKTKKFAIVDRTPDARLYPTIEKAIRARNEQTIDPATHKPMLPRFEVELTPASTNTAEAIADQRFQLSERVRSGELFGFLDIGADVLEVKPASRQSSAIRYQSNRMTNKDFPQAIEKDLLHEIQEIRLSEAHLSAPRQTIRDIMKATPVESMGLMRRHAASDAIEEATQMDRIAPLAVPIAFSMMMFMVVMMTASPLMQSVVEEKMQRIAEVLLGSVRPFDLMLGKLLGVTAVSLTITTVYLISAYLAAQQYGFTEYIPLDLLAWFVVFQTLSLLMFGSLFIAVGAACTDMKETQNLMWPVMLLALLPLLLMGPILQEPNSFLAVSLSFFPFSTPTLMILRQTVPPGVPSWHPIVGVGLVLLTTLLCVWAAGRIFRVGILMQGKCAKLGEMLHWIMHD